MPQKGYDDEDERKLRQEMKEREVLRQMHYSKDDEKKLQEEIDRKSGDEKEQTEEN